nr:hypothetical transcript [Hymenolepis microstoma]
MRREQSLTENEEGDDGGRILSLTELLQLGTFDGRRIFGPLNCEESLKIQQRQTSIPEPVFTLYAFLARQGVYNSDLFRRPGNISQMNILQDVWFSETLMLDNVTQSRSSQCKGYFRQTPVDHSGVPHRLHSNGQAKQFVNTSKGSW